MRWCCFLFWFIYRLTLSCLAHFNWLVALYVNCAYFVLWKSYDLLWFWMHLMLCSCFKPLRSENYLIVWCNLLCKQRTRYPHKTYKEIYMIEYGKKKNTKAEQELERIDTLNARDRDKQDHSSSSDEDDAPPRSYTRSGPSQRIPVENGDEIEESEESSEESNEHKVSAQEIMAEEERECMEQVFIGRAVPSYPDLESNQTGPEKSEDVPPRPSRPSRQHSQQSHVDDNGDVQFVTSNRAKNWISRINPIEACRTRLRNGDGIGPTTEMVSGGDGNHTDTTSIRSVTWSDRIHRFIPRVFNRSSTSEEEYDGPMDVIRPDFTNPYDLRSSKSRVKREKRDRKALTKRIRERRRAELAIIARREERERTISSAIELLLQMLRMMTSFAILVGNIRKTFIPAQFKWLKPGQNAYDNPALLLLFRCTVFLDVLLFWTNVIWAYCLQWHLCCRLGLIRFWMWALLLITIGGVVVFLPMSQVQHNLDISWCRFMPNSSFANFQPTW